MPRTQCLVRQVECETLQELTTTVDESNPCMFVYIKHEYEYTTYKRPPPLYLRTVREGIVLCMTLLTASTNTEHRDVDDYPVIVCLPHAAQPPFRPNEVFVRRRTDNAVVLSEL